MSSIVKENEVLTATPEAGVNASATAALTSDAANKPQPVALEVAVSVNGARTVEGSDKREPFSEATKTVLVFGNGAVIRLSSSVAAGQLLFLTNEKTKKEVVCQVVKSKNYRNVSGYVELEFTEPVTGFWGLRFPGDRIGSQPAPGRPVAVTSPAASAPSAALPAVKSEALAPQAQVPAAPKAVAPVAAQTSAPVAAKPSVPPNISPASPEPPAAPVLHMRRASDVKPVTPAPTLQPLVTPVVSQITNLPPAAEVKLPAAPVMAAPPAAKADSLHAAKDNSSDALKLEAARLQEQLSSLLFTEAPKPTKQALAIPVVDKKEVTEAAAKLFEIAKTEPAPAAAKPVQPARSAPLAVKSLLDSEEVKIPAWLEPLARNVAAPASTEELIEREKAKHAAAAVIEETPVALTPLAEPLAEEESSAEVAVPTFGSLLAIDEDQSELEGSVGGSKKGILIGVIAAGVLIAAAGGTWYLRQQSGGPQAGVVTSTATQAAAIPAAGTPGTALQPLATSGSSVPVSSVSNVAPSGKASAVVPPAANSQAASSVRELKESSVASNTSAPGRNTQPALPQPQPKKSALGEVHLAAPTVKHGASAQESAEADPAISLNGGQIASNDDSLGGGIATANTRLPVAPAAPLPVGGDVKPAKLVASVPPSYPTLAKTQHVSGDVKVDALIDTNGRVTTMKVISGPTLLHQSAMDALRQWKYQAATLDGKPVAMHLTVTIQFRLQ
jgi:TonB family protein